jgi:hypothetical protein
VLYTGSNVVFEMSATATSFAGGALVGKGSVSAGSSVDIGHTLAWAGVQSVRGADGNLVDVYSMTGLGSGFDFGRSQTPAVTPVPEPETWAMLMAGLMIVARLGRRRATGRAATT